MAGAISIRRPGRSMINNAKAVEALQFYGDLMTKYKVVVPDAITWEFDEIVAGGQNDRYAMTITLAPYGTLINDPKLSKTGGKWAWAVAPGRAFAGRKPGQLSAAGRFGVPSAVQAQGVGVRVHPVRRAARNGCAARCVRGNAPPRRIGAEPSGRAGALRLGAGAGRSDEDRDARAARRDLADDGIAAAQRDLRRCCWARSPRRRRWMPSRQTGSAACVAPG